jgi:BlaI family transcriptional regulator, penicillinase repressor
MEVVWNRKAWLTTRETLEALSPRRRFAYTTIMTILVRLWRKGLLERKRDGRAYAYHAVLTREQWTAQRMGELLAVCCRSTNDSGSGSYRPSNAPGRGPEPRIG